MAWTDVLKEKIILVHSFRQKIKLSVNQRSEIIRRIFAKLPIDSNYGGSIASAYAGIIAGYVLELDTCNFLNLKNH